MPGGDGSAGTSVGQPDLGGLSLIDRGVTDVMGGGSLAGERVRAPTFQQCFPHFLSHRVSSPAPLENLLKP